MRITIPHLLAELRVKGYPNIADVEYAVLEETGDISVVPKSDKRPLQPSDLATHPIEKGTASAIIIDGEAVDTNLNSMGKDRTWLINLLNSYGIPKETIEYISLATIDDTGKLHVDYFDIRVKPE